MLELARIGVDDQNAFRRDLLLYLQVSERYTALLEQLAKVVTITGWESIVESIDQRDDLRELHGACQRVLDSYPDHPALLLVSAITRVDPSLDGVERSKEELLAALRFGMDLLGPVPTKTAAAFAVRFSALVDAEIAARLRSIFGAWLLLQGFANSALKECGYEPTVFDAWITNLDEDISLGFPRIEGAY